MSPMPWPASPHKRRLEPPPSERFALTAGSAGTLVDIGRSSSHRRLPVKCRSMASTAVTFEDAPIVPQCAGQESDQSLMEALRVAG